MAAARRRALVVIPPTVGHINNGVALSERLTDAGWEPILLSGASAADYLSSLGLRDSWLVSECHDYVTNARLPGHRPHLVQLADPERLQACHILERRIVADFRVQLIVVKDYFSAVATARHLNIPYVGYCTDGVESAIPEYSRQTIDGARAVTDAADNSLAALGCTERLGKVPGCLYDGLFSLVRGFGETDWVSPAQLCDARRYQYAGFLVFDGTADQLNASSQIMLDVPRPFCYVNFGTVLRDVSRLSLLPAVAQIAGLHLVVAHPEAPVLLAGQPRTTAIRYLPNEIALRHASVVLHHGGFGITLSALRAGVPQIVVPDNERTSQRYHGHALERLGVGVVAESGADRASWLAETIKTLMSGNYAHVATMLAARLAIRDREIGVELESRLAGILG